MIDDAIKTDHKIELWETQPMKYRSSKKSPNYVYRELEPRRLLAGDLVCAGAADNLIEIRINASDPMLVDVEIDSVVQSFATNDPAPLTINAEAGNDSIVIDHSNGTPETLGGIVVKGGDGSDQLSATNITASFFTIESVGANQGMLGSNLTFSAIESLQGSSGPDRFDIRSLNADVSIDGGDGNDVFRIGSLAPDFFNSELSLLNGNISIEGGAGQNRILMSGRGGGGLNLTISETVIGGYNGEFAVSYAATGGSFSNLDGSIGGITIFGSNASFTAGADNFSVVGLNAENSLKLRASAGDDSFTVLASVDGDVSLDGGVGFNQAGIGFQGFGDRRIEVGFQNVNDEFFLTGTAGSDVFTFDNAGVTLGTEELLLSPMALFIEGQGGDDQFVFNSRSNDVSATIEINAGSGDNQLIFRELEDEVFNGIFVDTISTASTVLLRSTQFELNVIANAFGGTFDLDQQGFKFDLADNSKLNFFVNGLHETDSVWLGSSGPTVVQPFVSIAEDAFGDVKFDGVVNGWVVVNANGTARSIAFEPREYVSDTKLIINGNDDGDQFVLNSRLVQHELETIAFDETVDRFEIIGGEGGDEFIVESTEVQTVLIGRGGDDVYRTAGNLDSIKGLLVVYSNDGNDSLIVDDSAATAAYNYFVGKNLIVPLPDQVGSRDFAGIVFGNGALENLTLRTSQANNLIRIRPSSTTDIRIVDNGGAADRMSLVSEPFDGHDLNLASNDSEGFWSFDHAFRDLQFEGFEFQHADE